jgi:hypothetical protein
MRRMLWMAGAAGALALAACAEPATAPPAAGRPQFGIGSPESGGVIWRSDSLTRMAYVTWDEGPVQHFVSISEGMLNGQRTALVGYGAMVASPCWWDPAETCWDGLSTGWGTVDAKDVRGGAGAMAVETNTAPDANPAFWHDADPGGWVRVSVRQLPETRWPPIHDVGRWQWGNLIFTYNTHDEGRAAVATGEVVGLAIPASATARLTSAMSHGQVMLAW